MTAKKPLTIIESPFSAPTVEEIVLNVQYAFLAVRDSLERGEAPYASHLFYTQMLDDNVAAERQLGIAAGLDIGSFATLTAVYTDFGISGGMEYGINIAKEAKREVIERNLFPLNLTKDELISLMLQEYEKHNLPPASVLASIYGRIIR